MSKLSYRDSTGALNEFIDGEGDTFHVKRTFDVAPVMDSAAALRSAGKTELGESWHVGRVDARVLSMWIKEAGLEPSDTHAIEDMLKKKLLDGDFSKFRVHEGTF